MPSGGILGTITRNAYPLSGVTVRLTALAGGATQYAYTDGAGVFTFYGLADGTYELVPAKSYYTFHPASQTVVIAGGVIVNSVVFAAELVGTNYRIEGYIYKGATALVGIQVNLNDGDVAFTDSNGFYEFWRPAATWTVTPADSRYTFDPDHQDVTLTTTNLRISPFYASVAGQHSISGTVLDGSSNPVSGVAIAVTGRLEKLAYTAADGTYIIIGLEDGTYTLTPSKLNCTFAPTSLLVTLAGADATGKDFTATVVSGHSVGGTILDGATGVADVHLLLQGSNGVFDALTDASGVYSIVGVPDGTYTLTPGKAGYSFTPTSLAITVAGSDLSGKDFAAAAVTSYSITGTILDGDGNPVPGVTVSCEAGTAQTSAAGLYQLYLPNGTYLLTPTKDGYSFTPATRSVTVNGASIGNLDFTAVGAGTTFAISGTILKDGAGLAGVLVVAGTKSATTNAAGAYSILGLADGSYTVTPSLSGYLFTPETRSAVIAGASVSGVDFVAAVDVPIDYSLPYVFANASGSSEMAIDADQINADLSFLLNLFKNIRDPQISRSARINPDKIASGLSTPRANLRADLLWVEDQLADVQAQLVAADILSPWTILLPQDVDLEVNGAAADGNGGTVQITAGKRIRMQGREFTTVATTLPSGAGMTPGSAYAVRCSKNTTTGALDWTLVPLFGPGISGSAESRRYLVAEVGTVTGAGELEIDAPTGTPLIGAQFKVLSGTLAGEEAVVAWQDTASQNCLLATALSAAPTAGDLLGVWLDNPDYVDNPGELGGESTPESALVAVVFTGAASGAPQVHRVANPGGIAQTLPDVVELPWSDILNVNSGSAAQEQTLTYADQGRPVKRVSLLLIKQDDVPGNKPTHISLEVGASWAGRFYTGRGTVAKGITVSLAPGKVTLRASDGHLAILDGTDGGVVVKGVRIKATLEF